MKSFAVSLTTFLHSRLSTKALGIESTRFYLKQRPSRNLLPHPPMPHPHGHGHGHHSSTGYRGCFGISDDEVLSSAVDYFGEDVPPCAVYVNDTLVAGQGGGSSSSGSSESGGSSSPGSSESDGSSSSGSWWSGWFGGGGSNGGSSSGGSSGSNGDVGGSESDGSGSNVDSDANNNESRVYNDDAVNNNMYGNVNDDGDYSSPLVYFNLLDCGSYSNLWLWDLALSCDNSTSLNNCQCSSAEILYQYGTLQCPDGTADAPSCPSNCPVCHTCMSLIGCIEKVPFAKRIPVNIPENLERTFNRALPIALGIAAAVVTLLAGVAAHKHKNERDDKSTGSLNTSLVEGHSDVEVDIAGNAHVI